MYFQRSQYEVGDLYDSIQAIQDNHEPNEGFGRRVSGQIYAQEFPRTGSYKELHNFMSYDDGVKKSFSSNSFHDNEEFQPCYEKPALAYSFEDHSTMTSFPSAASLGSQNSFMSTNTLNPMSKSRAKMVNAKKKNNNSGESDYKKKYKTEVCKFWAEKGFCEYGDGCAFAHGSREIRQKSHIPQNYKTKKCIQFHESGFCPYGSRCQFIHSLTKDVQTNPNLERGSYGEIMDNPEIWVKSHPDCTCMQKKTRRRLPSFQHVSSLEQSYGEEHDHVCL